MRSSGIFCMAILALAGCAGQEEDLAAVRAVTMSGPALSWEDLDVHPTLKARACAVTTLVNRSGMPVGYCHEGRNCRTMDWRPVEDGCRLQRSAGRI